MKVIKNKSKFPESEHIELIRKQLLNDYSEVNGTTLGAVSKYSTSNRTVRNIAKSSICSRKKGELLHKIAKYQQSNTMLELGTSLGISTAYLAKANSQASVITLEGNPDLVNSARKNAAKLGITNIKFLEGNFDVILPQVLSSQSKPFDLVYLDGNHKKVPTIGYFEQLQPYLHDNSVLIVDDIYWSKEMTEAWKFISNHSNTTISVDLFECGLVFFSKRFSKQQFCLKF